jgi:Tol biopolymer transport system component/alpha-tubulin suppressor-like RCC1 family protein/lysophospholipase L1-like esterase/chitodextrinase
VLSIAFGISLIAALPPQLSGLADTPSTAISPNAAVVWGWNFYGQLGGGGTANQSKPSPVPSLPNNLTTLAGGYDFTLATQADGTLWAFGANWGGQLGDGTMIERHGPVVAAHLPKPASSLAGGCSGDSYALLSDSSVMGWGSNAYGELADGTLTQRLTPVSSSGLGVGVSAIAAGCGNLLALKSDGSVLSVGYNGHGDLGDGTVTSRGTPKPIPGLSGITAVAMGWDHGLALKANGSVVAWGLNSNGQLGSGTTVESHSPVSVTGLPPGIVAVAADGNHSMALASDGSVWGWGENREGEVGDGTTVDRLTPVGVNLSAGAAVTSIAAGADQSYAVRADGSLLAWGNNAEAELGDGTTINRYLPIVTLLPANTPVRAFSAGGYHALVLSNSVSPAPTPVIQSISPSYGPAGGGTQITITGSGLTNTTIIGFGNGVLPLRPCDPSLPPKPCFTVLNDSTISALMPASPVGDVHVSLATPTASSTTAGSDLFTFEGWVFPTPADGTAVDVALGSSSSFTVKAFEQGTLTIGHSGLPSGVTCRDTANPGHPAQVDCTVAPTTLGLTTVTFFDATISGRISTRSLLLGSGTYSALGDSFSAGDGVPPYIPPTDSDGCHRSNGAYGPLVASALYGGAVKFVACSGAVIRDVYFGKGKPISEDPQVSALGPQDNLVTITIGGNDIGFADVAKTCVALDFTAGFGCRWAKDGPTRASIARISAPGTWPAVSPQDSTKPFDDQIFNLDRLYKAIRARIAPHARLIVLGYPRLLATNPGIVSCQSLSIFDEGWLNSIELSLNQEIKARALRIGAEYLDVYDAFDGHELCPSVSNNASFVNPVTVFPTDYTPVHPNSLGQARIEQILLNYIRQGAPSINTVLVAPNQTATTPAIVPAGTGQASFSAIWPGSDVVMSLVSPSGRLITRSTIAPDVEHVVGGTNEVTTISNPEAGQWTIKEFGASVTPDGELVRINAVSMPPINVPPTASFTASSTNGIAPLQVNFDGRASSDPDDAIASYSWDFGDGSTASGAVVSHAYTRPGTYQAHLTVTDSGGAQGFAGQTIRVRNNVIAFSSTRDGHLQVYTMKPDGTGQTRLTFSPADDSEPILSPDGTRVAFTSTRGGHSDIWVMNTAPESSTNVATNLTVNPSLNLDPTWAPDGSRIAFASNRSGKFQVWVINKDGSGLIRLTTDAANDANPAWSPDGTRLAFASDSSGRFQIYVATLAASPALSITSTSRLTTDAATDVTPAWSPDSTLIAFTGNATQNPEIWVIGSQPGATAVPQTSNPAAVEGPPTWSADGAMIAFTSTTTWSVQIYKIIYNSAGLGTGQTPITTGATNELPNWCCTAAPN